MPPRHPLPRVWLMTDERLGEDLWRALDALPRGGGVVFRHYATPAAERRTLFARVRQVARRNRLVLVVAGAPIGRAAGHHGRDAKRTRGLRTWPAHSRVEVLAGVRAGVDLLFVSPIFATCSHPGGRVLGARRAAAMLRGVTTPTIALGGMNARRFRKLDGFYGWAAIDAWTAQKRNAVPI